MHLAARHLRRPWWTFCVAFATPRRPGRRTVGTLFSPGPHQSPSEWPRHPRKHECLCDHHQLAPGLGTAASAAATLPQPLCVTVGQQSRAPTLAPTRSANVSVPIQHPLAHANAPPSDSSACLGGCPSPPLLRLRIQQVDDAIPDSIKRLLWARAWARSRPAAPERWPLPHARSYASASSPRPPSRLPRSS